MRYNRKVQTLPDWFDLAKYDSLRSANTFEWYTQIVIRRECWDSAHHYDPMLENQADQLPPMPLGGAEPEILALIRRDGVVDIKEIRRVCMRAWGGDPMLGSFDRLERSIHPITVNELYWARVAIEEKGRTRFDELFISERTPEGRRPYDEIGHLFNSYDGAYERSGVTKPVYHYQRNKSRQFALSTVRVDLNLPDSLLIKEFKHYLRKARGEAGLKSRTIRRQGGKQWARWRVLPYIDLILWARETGVRLRKTTVADALYPEGGWRDAERVRKTVKPLAMSLLRRDSVPFQQLKHQAARLRNTGIGNKKRR